MVSSMPLPEILVFMGILVFVVVSLLSSLLDAFFSKWVPYAYQVGALIGFGHLYASNYLFQMSKEARVMLSIIYLIFTIANVVALNVYIARNRERSPLPHLHHLFLSTVTLPTILIASLLVCGRLEPPLLPVPTFSIELIFTLVAGSITVLGGSLIITYKPQILVNLLKKVQEKRQRR